VKSRVAPFSLRTQGIPAFHLAVLIGSTEVQMFGFIGGVLSAIALVFVFDGFFEWRKAARRRAGAHCRPLAPVVDHGKEAA
jgi:hypothetical protein